MARPVTIDHGPYGVEVTLPIAFWVTLGAALLLTTLVGLSVLLWWRRNGQQIADDIAEIKVSLGELGARTTAVETQTNDTTEDLGALRDRTDHYSVAALGAIDGTERLRKVAADNREAIEVLARRRSGGTDDMPQ